MKHAQVVGRTIVANLKGNNRLYCPSVILFDELCTYRTLSLLLLPKLHGKTLFPQPIQHPLALPLRKVGVPCGIEGISFRLNLDMTDDASFFG